MHVLRVLQSKLRESAKRGSLAARVLTGEKPRSPHWHKVEVRWKKTSPKCAACGSTKNVQVHHIRPFHLMPQFELADGTGEFCTVIDPKTGKFLINLISLCMDKNECHLRCGHLCNFKLENLSVVEDAAAIFAAKPETRPIIWQRLKAAGEEQRKKAA